MGRMARPALLVVICVLLNGCRSPQSEVQPSIEFTRVPEAGQGGPDRVDMIEGRVAGWRSGQQIVLFAKSGVWWVQPLSNQPFTIIRADSTWQGATHLGGEYAALLVDAEYRPPARTPELPAVGGGVVAVAIVRGQTPAGGFKVLQFSGYEWRVRNVPSERGGFRIPYALENAWTDDKGALHLRVASNASGWTFAEVSLTRSFGYGTYAFVVRDTSHLEPRTVLGLFTWDEAAADEKHREMSVEISRWGDPTNKNAQYMIQPYFVPANVTRFTVPAGVTTHTLRWEQGRARFRSVRGRSHEGGAGSSAIAAHEFTSGIPSPGSETVRINLYAFGAFDSSRPIDDEVVIEKFEYLP
jgi:hypothetical protein